MVIPKRGRGRPTIDPDAKLSSRLVVCLTQEEEKLLTEVAWKKRKRFSSWARKILVREAKRPNAKDAV